MHVVDTHIDFLLGLGVDVRGVRGVCEVRVLQDITLLRRASGGLRGLRGGEAENTLPC